MEIPTNKSNIWEESLSYIVAKYGNKRIELDYTTPFQLLCAVILSAQTTDKQVNKVTPPFFDRVKESSDVMSMTLDEIETHLKYINFFRNKSRFIKMTGTIITQEHN